MRAEVASSSGNGTGAGAARQGKRQGAQSGYHLGGVAGGSWRWRAGMLYWRPLMRPTRCDAVWMGA